MNHEIKQCLGGERILPSDHGDGVPWCSHMVCPAYEPAREDTNLEDIQEGSRFGLHIEPDGSPERCSLLAGKQSGGVCVVCIPAVRVMADRMRKKGDL